MSFPPMQAVIKNAWAGVGGQHVPDSMSGFPGSPASNSSSQSSQMSDPHGWQYLIVSMLIRLKVSNQPAAIGLAVGFMTQVRGRLIGPKREFI